MLALKDNCVHPQTKKPYLKMAMGGMDNSPEGKQVSYLDHPSIPVENGSCGGTPQLSWTHGTAPF